MALVAYGLILCVYAVTPPGSLGGSMTERLPGTYRTAHVLAYAVLTALLVAAGTGSGRAVTEIVALAAAMALAIGAGLELVQCLIPWRNGRWMDFLMDLIGVALAAALCLGWTFARRTRLPERAGFEDDPTLGGETTDG